MSQVKTIEATKKEYQILVNRDMHNMLTGKEIFRMKELEYVLKKADTGESEGELPKQREEVKKEASKLVSSPGVFVPSEEATSNRIEYIPLSKIVYPEFKDRSGIDKGKIERLAKSIEAVGLIQPVVLLKQDDGKYLKISGRRRIEAIKVLGRTKIKADVREGINREDVAIMIAHENLEREDLSLYDKVRQFIFFMDFYLVGLSEDEKISIIKRSDNLKKGNVKSTEEGEKALESIERAIEVFGMGSLSSLVRKLGVLKMPEEVIAKINSNEIGFKVAVEASKYKNKVFKEGSSFGLCLKEIVENQCSAKEAKAMFILGIKKETKEKDSTADRVSVKMNEFKKIIKNLNESDLKQVERNIDKIIEKFVT